MQIILIISAIIVSLGTMAFAIGHSMRRKEEAGKIYDPKLRVTPGKSVPVWIFALLSIASLISLIWSFGFYGRQFNYEGGFTLRPSARWQLVETEIADQEQYYRYSDSTNTIGINVVSLGRGESRERRAEIRRTRDELTAYFDGRPRQLRRDARTEQRELRSQARRDRREIRRTYRGNRQQRNEAIGENRAQLRTDIGNVRTTLEQDIAINNEHRRNVWRNGWLQRDRYVNSFEALHNRRLYTVDVTSREDLANINIRPFRFFAGVFDGSTFAGTIFLVRINVMRANGTEISTLTVPEVDTFSLSWDEVNGFAYFISNATGSTEIFRARINFN